VEAGGQPDEVETIQLGDHLDGGGGQLPLPNYDCTMTNLKHMIDCVKNSARIGEFSNDLVCSMFDHRISTVNS